MSEVEKLIDALTNENEKLKEENKRLRDKLNKPLMMDSREMALKCSEMYEV